MNNPFKIGDMVISTRIEMPLWLIMTKGEQYEVKDVEDDMIVIIGDDGSVITWPAREFRLASSGGSRMKEKKEIKVDLIDYTGRTYSDPARYASAVLIFAKSTRLNMEPQGFQKIMYDMPEQEMLFELGKIAATIPSSWEFVEYTFLISNVTRAFTHQLVRGRHASYAQQAMRVVDMQGWDYDTGPTIKNDPEALKIYENGMAMIDKAYRALIDRGVKSEDARGILPTNIKTNILCKLNLRSFVETYRKRSSQRVQDEFRTVMEYMKAEAIKAHPFLTLFIDRPADKAFKRLEELIAMPEFSKDEALKLLFQLRQEV